MCHGPAYLKKKLKGGLRGIAGESKQNLSKGRGVTGKGCPSKGAGAGNQKLESGMMVASPFAQKGVERL